jgi:hypothetical protein
MQVTVNAGGVVTEKTPVWIQIVLSTDSSKTQVREGEIDIGQSNVNIEVLPLDSGGIYFVLAMVGGRDQVVEDINVP